MYISRRCSELVAHIQNTNTQYNLPAFVKKISRKFNRDGVAERFEDPEVQKRVDADLAIIDSLNEILKKLEGHIEPHQQTNLKIDQKSLRSKHLIALKRGASKSRPAT